MELISSSELIEQVGVHPQPISPRDAFARTREANDEALAYAQPGLLPVEPARPIGFRSQHDHSMDNSYRLYCGGPAKLITPGSNEPQGFILTTILGIVGAFVSTYLGHALGWYRAGEGAGLIGATVGAVLVLLVWAAVKSCS